LGGDEGSSVDGLGLGVEVGVRAAFGLAGRRTKRGRGVENVRGGRCGFEKERKEQVSGKIVGLTKLPTILELSNPRWCCS